MKISSVAPRAAKLVRPSLACLVVLSCLLVAFASRGASVGGGAGAAQRGAITGDWRVDFDRGKPDVVSLSITRGDWQRGGGAHSDGPVNLGELQGLTREQAFGARQKVVFRIAREAGTFECEGAFTGGHGSGTWRLTPSDSFVAAMRSRGYALSSDKELFESALFDVTVAGVDALKAEGYDRVPFDKLVETRIFDVTPALIAEMRDAGYANLTLDNLVEARIFKIDRKFIDEIRALGFRGLSFHHLVDMRSQNVTADYVREMRGAGFDLTAQELVDFKVFEVTAQFVRDVRAEGYPAVTPREIVDLKVFKIDPAFIRRVKARGFANATIDQIVEMRSNGSVK